MNTGFREITYFSLVADGAKSKELKIKITQNEACTLQNQVREEMKALRYDILCFL
jgi:hypothetical protein